MPTLLVLAYCDNGSLLDHVQAQGEETNASTKLTFCAEVAQGMEYIASRRVVSTGFFKTLIPRNSCSQFGVCVGSCFFGGNCFRFIAMWPRETFCLMRCSSAKWESKFLFYSEGMGG